MVVFSLMGFLIFTTAPTASAQQAGPFYVGIFGGFVMPNDLEWSYDKWNHHDEVYDEDLDESWAIGVKVGYIIPQVKWLAFELEYTHLAKQDYSETEYYGSPIGHNGEFSANNLMANLLFRYPQGRIHPYVGFGLGLSTATIEESGTFDDGGIVRSYKFDEDETGFACQFIAGLNFELMPNLSADFAYKYLYSEYEIEDWDVEAKNHMFLLGINFHF
jgi:opacity protein-like surface antigen